MIELLGEVWYESLFYGIQCYGDYTKVESIFKLDELCNALWEVVK